MFYDVGINLRPSAPALGTLDYLTQSFISRQSPLTSYRDPFIPAKPVFWLSSNIAHSYSFLTPLPNSSVGTLRKLECTFWSDRGLSSLLLERTCPLPSLMPTFKVGICQLPRGSIYISDIHLSRRLWIHLYFPYALHHGAMCFPSLLPIYFICSNCSLLIFPSSKYLC